MDESVHWGIINCLLHHIVNQTGTNDPLPSPLHPNQTHNQLKPSEAGRTATPHAWAQQRSEWIRV